MENAIDIWLAQEQAARNATGWDFSPIAPYCREEPLPWDYRTVVNRYRRDNMTLLDTDTGGGEFLLSLGHPAENTHATENYPPNVARCRSVFAPLGIPVTQCGADLSPLPDGQFDLVLNRHGDFDPAAIARVLKPEGRFVTQQVGADNDRELVELLCGDLPRPFPGQYLTLTEQAFRQAGFRILEAQECRCPITFTDVGALVWFACRLPWEFPDFSVAANRSRLLQAQRLLERDGEIRGSVHRFLLVAERA